MSEFYIRSKGIPSVSRFVIGRDSGTLFFMITHSRGIVLVGKGVFEGREGQDVRASAGRGVDRLPEGTILEIIV